jgi:SAM-dependent methyltransferase
MRQLMDSEKTVTQSAQDIQRDYFNRLLDRYEAHYDDPTSQAYRRKYIFNPMFDGIQFEGKTVLEAMCGSGPTTAYLLERNAIVTGLDVSDSAIESFNKRWPECQSIRASIFDSTLPAESFDMVVVQAGLHHLHPRLNDAMEEINRILKPGGYFCFSEPHTGSLYDGARKLWYRLDRDIFAENEESVDIATIKNRYADHFDTQVEHYLGNIAYFLVAQSMVLRIPLAAKKYYAPTAFLIEGLLSPMMGRRTAPLIACRWRKKGKA